LNAGTGAGKDTESGICNIPNGHAYSIIAVFNLTAPNGTVIPALMLRNPWGHCSNNCYNQTLNSNDKFWTSSTIN
jgi:Calpain family cysteine protease